MRRDAMRVHLAGRGPLGPLRTSLCGRYWSQPEGDPLYRLRMTSAVSCRHCINRHKRGETAPPQGAMA